MFKKILLSVLAVMFLATGAAFAEITFAPGVETEVIIEKDINLSKLSLDGTYRTQYYDLFLETQVCE